MSIEGHVALVTGSGSGIGRATALTLARHGARLALADRNLTAVKEVRDDIATFEREALAIRVDVAESRSVQELETCPSCEHSPRLGLCEGIPQCL